MDPKKTNKDRTEDRSHDIVLKIEGDRVDSASFFACVEHFLGLLREVQQNRIKDSEQLTWLISVDRGSCVLRATPLVVSAIMPELAEIGHTLDSGIRTIEDTETRPDNFSDAAIEKLRLLARKIGVDEEGVGVAGLRIGTSGECRAITSRSVTNASRLLTTPKPAFGSVRGRLEVIAGKNGLSVQIHNENQKLRVECLVEEEFLETIMRAFRKRVSAYGKITYDRRKKPKSLKIQSLRIIDDEDMLPKMYDVLGALNG